MEWKDITITVPKAEADLAEAIATGISGGGIYIEDYSDLEQQVEAIAHVDLIEQELRDKDRSTVVVHLYLSPDENPAEVLSLIQERLLASGLHGTVGMAVSSADGLKSLRLSYQTGLGRTSRMVPVRSSSSK